MNAVPVTETLGHLRRTLAQIDPARRSANASGHSLSLRVAAIDDALQITHPQTTGTGILYKQNATALVQK